MARDGDSREGAVEKHAAGFVLHRREGGGIAYLLLRNARHGDVGFPKGHREGGETNVETALRETWEETGLRAEPNAWFRRAIRYRVGGRLKEVVYLLASADRARLRLSREHDWGGWMGFDGARALLEHPDLAGVLRDAATYLKDPALRHGLSPAAARALLEARAGGSAPVVAHASQVAAMARALAGAWDDGLDSDYVEAAAWVHDIGRTVSHGTRHTVEGFGLLVAEGWPGYAPPCLSHYAKGRPRQDLGAIGEEFWTLCDMETFDLEEQLVALADFMAAGPRRVRLEERHADLVARYGASRFLDRSLACARDILAAFEEHTGRRVYELAGIA